MQEKFWEFREEIDKINSNILALLNIRTNLIKNIADLKDISKIEYFDPVREMEMLENIFKQNKGPLSNDMVKEIFTAIFSTNLRYMGIKREKKMLISSENDGGFLKINEIFPFIENEPAIIAGPCAIEKREYLEGIASLLKSNKLRFLRGGAFKPRTSPYEFQGLGEDGLKILSETGKKFNLFTVTEIVDPRDVDMASRYVDIIQIGARNMQNFELLKEVGQSKHPVLLKRGLNATMQEFMFAAEYIGIQGNRKIILCERGIRTFETKTRNTLDISCVPIIKKETSLPIIIDLSHSLGRKDIINPIAKAAIAVGADGLMLEVHPYPELAFSDSKQQLNPEEFINLLNNLQLKKSVFSA